MRGEERLFSAIGEADPFLIARTEKRRRKHWGRYCLAAAACFALLLAAGQFQLRRETPDVQPPPAIQGTDSGTSPEDAGSYGSFFPPRGSEIGTLRLLSYAPESQEETADFLIYVNEDQFSIYEENGLYSIRSTNTLPGNFPECGLDILHLSGVSPAGAREAAGKALEERYASVTSEELAAVLPDSLYLRASAGTDWDSEQAELWFVSDGQEGTFTLTARYFLEAEEGMGMRFRDMVSSFRAIPRNEAVPEWMASLYEASGRLFPALLSGDLSGVSDLLEEDASADAYGENVWEYVTIASVDYAPDDDQDPNSAIVSVKHRLNLEEGESFHYLTMRLVRLDGQWRLSWSSIEK